MTLTDTLTLISTAETEDSDGYTTTSETEKEVMCDSGSGVTRTEFYEAFKAGIKLSAAFEMWLCDYDGQTILEHGGKRYKVERAHQNHNTIQLNCSEVVR